MPSKVKSYRVCCALVKPLEDFLDKNEDFNLSGWINERIRELLESKGEINSDE